MKLKRIIALVLMVCCIGTAASCSKTPDTSAESSAISIDSSDESVDETEETEDIEITEFFSLENLSAAEIKTTLEMYYTELVPKEGQSVEEFRLGLPKLPERVVNDNSKCHISYRGLGTEGHSRILVITWEGFNKNEDSGVFNTTDSKSPKTTFDMVIQGKDLALALLDLYRQEINSIGFDQVNDQNQGDIWEITATSNFVDQIGTKTVSVLVSPATTEGDDFWTVTVKHFYVN